MSTSERQPLTLLGTPLPNLRRQRLGSLMGSSSKPRQSTVTNENVNDGNRAMGPPNAQPKTVAPQEPVSALEALAAGSYPKRGGQSATPLDRLTKPGVHPRTPPPEASQPTSSHLQQLFSAPKEEGPFTEPSLSTLMVAKPKPKKDEQTPTLLPLRSPASPRPKVDLPKRNPDPESAQDKPTVPRTRTHSDSYNDDHKRTKRTPTPDNPTQVPTEPAPRRSSRRRSKPKKHLDEDESPKVKKRKPKPATKGKRKPGRPRKNKSFEFQTPDIYKRRSFIGNSSDSDSGNDATVDEDSTRKPWTDEELAQLRMGYAKVNPQSRHFWRKVASFVESREPHECCEKWFASFDEKQNKKNAKVKTSDDKPVPKKTKYKAPPRQETAKFRKQIRNQWEKSQQGHADDLYNATPFKKTSLDSTEEGSDDFVAFDVEDIAFDVRTPVVEKTESKTNCDSETRTPDLLARIDRNQIDGYIAAGKRRIDPTGKLKKKKYRKNGKGKTAMATPKSKRRFRDDGDIKVNGVAGRLTPGGSIRMVVDETRFQSDTSDEEGMHSSEEEDVN